MYIKNTSLGEAVGRHSAKYIKLDMFSLKFISISKILLINTAWHKVLGVFYKCQYTGYPLNIM